MQIVLNAQNITKWILKLAVILAVVGFFMDMVNFKEAIATLAGVYVFSKV